MSHSFHHLLYVTLSIALSVSCSVEKGRVTGEVRGASLSDCSDRGTEPVNGKAQEDAGAGVSVGL